MERQTFNRVLIVGDYSSSFSTRELEPSSLEFIQSSSLGLSNSSTITIRELDLIGRKVVVNVQASEELPPADNTTLNLKKKLINKVELFPLNQGVYPLDQPRKFDLVNVLISDVQISDEQYIDGVLHGNISGRISAELKPIEKIDKTKKTPDENLLTKELCIPCSQLVKSGGFGIDKQQVNIGVQSGVTFIRFNPERRIDKLEVFYMGQRIWSTEELRLNDGGFVGGDLDMMNGETSDDHTKWGKFYFNYQGDEVVTVVVTGLEPETVWDYTLFCPNEIPSSAEYNGSSNRNQNGFTNVNQTMVDSSFYQSHAEVKKTGFLEIIKRIFGVGNNNSVAQQPKSFNDPSSVLHADSTSDPAMQSTGCLRTLFKGCIWYFIVMFLLSILFFILSKCIGNQISPVKSDDETEEVDDLEVVDETENKRTLLLTNVQFYTNSSDLLPSSRNELDRIVDYLKENKSIKATILGHTDNKGNKKKNLSLSQKRAEAVMEYIVEKGVVRQRLQAIGKGDTEPKASNTTAEGRLMNRRVEVELIGKVR
jgi:outer membrane protein OmpA-like peptidoglycan-associated protein